MRPDPEVNNLLLYCLALAARQFEMEVHAFVFMSNHYHLVVSENAAEVKLPEFMRWLNMHIAKLINDVRDRRENVWAQGSYNAVVLVDEAAVLDKIVYTICNPVAAGLVATPQAWPGLRSLPSNLERDTFEARHPGRYFKGDQPPKITLRLTRPPLLEGMSKRKYRELIRRQVQGQLAEVHQERAREDKASFLGREAIAKQDPEGRPPNRPTERSSHPCVACKDSRRRKALLKALKEFGSEHRRCLKAWRDKKRTVCFPAGTYGMARFHNARCSKDPGVYARE